MDEKNQNKKNFLDITQYSEKARKIIFGVSMAVLFGIVGMAMLISNSNTGASTAPAPTPLVNATQAPVNNESGVKPTSQPTYTAGAYPTSEQDAANQAQQRIIAQSKADASNIPTNPTDNDDLAIPNSSALQTIASKGMIEYCTDNPKETKQQKQARLQPYFHSDNSDYKSPQSIFYTKKCSLGDVDSPIKDANGNVVVIVGIAWGAQFDATGKAATGYSQYSVVVDKDGIVSFHD